MSFGFTLIEVLVAMSILGIAALVAIPNYHQFNESEKLSNAAAGLASILKALEANAQSSINCNTQTPNEWSINVKNNAPSNGTYFRTCDYVQPLGITTVNIDTSPVDIGMPVSLTFYDNATPTPNAYSCDQKPTIVFSKTGVSFNTTGCVAPNLVELEIKLTDQNLSAPNNTYCVDAYKGGVINVIPSC